MFRVASTNLAGLIAVVLGCALGTAAAQDCVLPRVHHPWGRYQVGSWKEVRVTTETLGPDGRVLNTSVTETKSTLRSVSDLGVVLNVEVVVHVDGKEFASPPQTVWNGFYGQQESQPVTVRKLGEAVIKVHGNQVACEQRQIQLDGTRGRQITVCYSPKISPYVLRKETVTGGNDVRTVAEAVAVNHRTEILGTVHPAALIKTTTTQGKSTRVTVETVSDDVPGGVVEHDSQEFDDQGKVIRRSKLELLAYEVHEPRVGNEPQRRRLFHRRDRRPERM